MSKTLLVDGNNLLKIGFHGVREFYHEGKHVGGIWHFLNTLRKFLEESNFDKVVVFWDSNTSTSQRILIYPKYKLNRKSSDNELKEESFNLTQLISDKVTIYSPSNKSYFKLGDKIKLYENLIPHYNVKTLKILTGDGSDNIDGIFYLGEKTLIKFFPELLEKEVNFTDILTKGEILLKENKDNTALQNLLSGKTKEGVFGQEFFEINEKLVDLDNPLINEDGKEMVQLYYSESLDPDGRGYKNLIRMMMEDGLFKFLPKTDDNWTYFLKPFLKLTRKEKTKFKRKN